MRPQPSEARVLEDLVQQVARGVEQHRLADITGPISKSYHDSRGWDYREIWRQSVRYVGSKHPVTVRIEHFAADVAGSAAVATMDVYAGSPTEDVIYQGSISAHFRREGHLFWRRWRITDTEGWQGAVEQYRD